LTSDFALSHIPIPLVAAVMSALMAACAGSSAVVGLPSQEFDRAYAAGYDVAAAERCGEPVDSGLVRHNLVEDVKRRGLDASVADKAGRTYDKTRSEFARKLRSRPEFCVTEYAVARETFAQYQKGEFATRP
jgi:hypothetical protein